jgi:hypothetical protein
MLLAAPHACLTTSAFLQKDKEENIRTPKINAFVLAIGNCIEIANLINPQSQALNKHSTSTQQLTTTTTNKQ